MDTHKAWLKNKANQSIQLPNYINQFLGAIPTCKGSG